MIFYRKDLGEAINQSVFPGLQGGPHNHTISGIAVALKMAQAPEFKAYQQQIVDNCRALADRSTLYMHSNLYRPTIMQITLPLPVHVCNKVTYTYSGTCHQKYRSSHSLLTHCT